MLSRVLLAALIAMSSLGPVYDALAQTSRTDTVIDAALKEANVTGQWVGELTTGYGSARIVMSLKQDEDDKVRGTYDVSGPGGMFIDQPVAGVFRGGSLSLRHNRTGSTFEAVIEGSSMEGIFMGKGGPQTLSAKRVAGKTQ